MKSLRALGTALIALQTASCMGRVDVGRVGGGDDASTAVTPPSGDGDAAAAGREASSSPGASSSGGSSTSSGSGGAYLSSGSTSGGSYISSGSGGAYASSGSSSGGSYTSSGSGGAYVSSGSGGGGPDASSSSGGVSVSSGSGSSGGSSVTMDDAAVAYPDDATSLPAVGSPACEDLPCILCADNNYHCHSAVYPPCPAGISTSTSCVDYNLASYGCFTCEVDGNGYLWQCGGGDASGGWNLNVFDCTP